MYYFSIFLFLSGCLFLITRVESEPSSTAAPQIENYSVNVNSGIIHLSLMLRNPYNSFVFDGALIGVDCTMEQGGVQQYRLLLAGAEGLPDQFEQLKLEPFLTEVEVDVPLEPKGTWQISLAIPLVSERPVATCAPPTIRGAW